ncbi:hypothetical protein J7T55_014756 [Diaporthe amygdali]|uniref:uncharacterized protein n=1 Tax=Phomopsis amygdali TaxID=1214568 RepID=UPI0022FDF636|nr:uncharacterized protein J7T55_014756 [Diaporthe amygdali]KAJ0109954.1 hypothetical protein J7T55_014756 [Diaporthe amygdali]
MRGTVPMACASLQDWHGDIMGTRDVAREAYNDAIQYLKTELREQDHDLSWLKTLTSMEDVQKTATEAQARYDSAGKSKVKYWLQKISSVVLYYNGVLDVLAQQHPEYLSIVWGSIRFILTGIVNHAELVNEFSKAIVDIAVILPQAKLSAELYESDQLKSAISQFYANILLFFKQAIDWYNLSSTRRAMSSLFRPYKLELKDTLDEVKRSMHILLKALSGELSDVRKQIDRLSFSVNDKLEVTTWSKPILEEIHFNVRDMRPRVVDIQFGQAMGLLTPRIAPLDAFRRQQRLARRIQPWISQNSEIAHLVANIGSWIAFPKPSLLVLEAGPKAETKAKEIVTELIGMLRPAARRLCWYLSTANSGNEGITLADIFKNLIYQLIRLDSVNMARILDGNLTSIKLQGEHTDREWIDLLCSILRHLQDCFIIVEAEDMFKILGKDVAQLDRVHSVFQLLVDQASNEGCQVKVLFVGYGRSTAASDTSAPISVSSRRVVSLRPLVPVPEYGSV